MTKGDESDESLFTPKSGLFGVTRDNARAPDRVGAFMRTKQDTKKTLNTPLDNHTEIPTTDKVES